MNDTIGKLRGALERAGLLHSSTSWIAAFAWGLGAGVIAGAAAAALLAPQTGAETRRRLGSGAKELAGRTTGLVRQAKESVSQLRSQNATTG